MIFNSPISSPLSDTIVSSHRDNSGFELSQWEEALLYKAFPYRPSPYPEWSLTPVPYTCPELGQYWCGMIFNFTLSSLQNDNIISHDRDHSGFGLSQWEGALLCKVFPHWLSPYPEWSLTTIWYGVGGAVRFLVVGTIGKGERLPRGQLWIEQYLISLKYWPIWYTIWADPNYIWGLAILADSHFFFNQ